nr:hypothetical protein [Tanacetum cinerariifolium]
LFNQEGKIVDSSKSESKSDCSNGDNACTSNILDPKIKRFPNSTSLLDMLFRFVYGALIRVFCDSDLEVAFRRNACFVRNLEGVNLLKGDRSTNLHMINLHEMASASPVCLMARASSPKSWLCINTLVEPARTMLIFSHAPLFLCAEAIATACFTQNRTIIHCRFNKTPYELINGRKSDISFLRVFGALCYPKNDREDIGKLGAKGDIGFSLGILSKPGLQNMTSGQINSRLDLTYAPSTITTQQPSEGELDLLFEAIYDYYIGGQPSSTRRTVLPAQEPQDVDEINLNSMVNGNTFVNPFANSFTSVTKDHPLEQVIREPSRPILTRNQLRSNGDMCMYALSMSTMEPNNVKEAMTDPVWIDSMQEELLQFKRLDVWVLVPAPDNISPLTLKWLFKNKHDEEQTVIRNKSRLIMRGYRQEEGIDFEESFAPQAPRAWYDELLTFLLQNHFFKGTIDPTLFIRRFHDDILVVQVYVDDIIFCFTHPRNPKKYGMEFCDPVGTPMEIKDKLDLDHNGTPVDATKYHSMISALMYLTSSRPDIVHATCLCARYQAMTTEKHLKEVKRIFCYLRGTINTGLWYTKDSGFELTRFSDVDYARCKDTFKSTSGGAQFLGEKLVSWSSKKQDYIAISCNPVQYSRTKHIAVRYHFIKEHVEKGTIEVYFVKTDYQLADIFTKALLADHFNYLVHRLARAGGIYPGTLPLDSVEVLGSDDGVTTSLQLSQNSRPPHARSSR